MGMGPPVATTTLSSSTKPKPQYPTLQYDGRTIYLKDLIGHLEHIDNVAYSEHRRIVRDGVRECQKKKENREHLKNMIDLALSIAGQLQEIRSIIVFDWDEGL